jgi:hypothetical protein
MASAFTSLRCLRQSCVPAWLPCCPTSPQSSQSALSGRQGSSPARQHPSSQRERTPNHDSCRFSSHDFSSRFCLSSSARRLVSSVTHGSLAKLLLDPSRAERGQRAIYQQADGKSPTIPAAQRKITLYLSKSVKCCELYPEHALPPPYHSRFPATQKPCGPAILHCSPVALSTHR